MTSASSARHLQVHHMRSYACPVCLCFPWPDPLPPRAYIPASDHHTCKIIEKPSLCILEKKENFALSANSSLELSNCKLALRVVTS